MSIQRYKGQPLPISIKFRKNPLISYGLDYSDIEDISMNLKVNLETDLDDQYLEKKLSDDGILVDEQNNLFIMGITESDYTNLIAGTTYYLTLNIKVSGIVNFIELPIEDRAVLITGDTNRE
jgi:hypothetical protein